jgi:hypothetical protein
MPQPNSTDGPPIEDTDHQENRSSGGSARPQRVCTAVRMGKRPTSDPSLPKGKIAYKAASLACCCKAVKEVDRAVCVSVGGKHRSLLALQHCEPRCDVPPMIVSRSRPAIADHSSGIREQAVQVALPMPSRFSSRLRLIPSQCFRNARPRQFPCRRTSRSLPFMSPSEPECLASSWRKESIHLSWPAKGHQAWLPRTPWHHRALRSVGRYWPRNRR